MTQIFGYLPDGEVVEKVTIAHAGLSASIITYGASLQDLRLEGVDHPLILGSDQLEPYFETMKYFGAIVGPVANRVRNGEAKLGDEVFHFERNENGKTTLHGGTEGTGQINWKLAKVEASSCRLNLHYPHLKAGFPGDLEIEVEYKILDENTLEVNLHAASLRPGFCNLASHIYWNLTGQKDIQDHQLQVYADEYLPLDGDRLPIGRPQLVKGSAFDFRKIRRLGDLGIPDLDHNFCFANETRALKPQCRLLARDLGLLVSSTEMGLQVYDSTFTDTKSDLGLMQKPYRARAGIAFEPQNWPDAPNHADYPSTLITPETPYHQLTRFTISRHD